MCRPYSNSKQTDTKQLECKSQSKQRGNEVHQLVLVTSRDVTYAGLTHNHKAHLRKIKVSMNSSTPLTI